MSSENTVLSPITRFIFGFVAFNALLGAIVLMFLPDSTDTLFFWTIAPPINAGLFGALYLGGALVVGWVTYRGFWEPARFLIPVLVSAGALISLTTFIHLDIFDSGIKLAYWLIIYIGAPLLALGLYVYYERRGANWTVTEPILPMTRNIALITGVVVTIAGAGLFLAAPQVAPHWAWRISPLMLRVFASWFSAFGIGLLWFRVEHDWSRLHYIATLMVAASGLDLVMIFLHRADLTADTLTILIYCLHLAVFGLVGLGMHWLQYRARQSSKTTNPLVTSV
ncbi:MAG: hypothetical protein RLP44_28570 [Aggregatilineales bacterium]